MAYNYDNRNCDYCGNLHWKGELTYLGRLPGQGDTFICEPCKVHRNSMLASKKASAERRKLRDSQPTLF